jgi:hypothetical protein
MRKLFSKLPRQEEVSIIAFYPSPDAGDRRATAVCKSPGFRELPVSKTSQYSTSTVHGSADRIKYSVCLRKGGEKYTMIATLYFCHCALTKKVALGKYFEIKWSKSNQNLVIIFSILKTGFPKFFVDDFKFDFKVVREYHVLHLLLYVYLIMWPQLTTGVLLSPLVVCRITYPFKSDPWKNDPNL